MAIVTLQPADRLDPTQAKDALGTLYRCSAKVELGLVRDRQVFWAPTRVDRTPVRPTDMLVVLLPPHPGVEGEAVSLGEAVLVYFRGDDGREYAFESRVGATRPVLLPGGGPATTLSLSQPIAVYRYCRRRHMRVVPGSPLEATVRWEGEGEISPGEAAGSVEDISRGGARLRLQASSASGLGRPGSGPVVAVTLDSGGSPACGSAELQARVVRLVGASTTGLAVSVAIEWIDPSAEAMAWLAAVVSETQRASRLPPRRGAR
jgi:hypothetical protein